MIYKGCPPTLTKTLRGKINYKPYFQEEEASSERIGAWPKVTQVGTGRAWTLQYDLENTQILPAREAAETLGDEPVAETGILGPQGLRGQCETWAPSPATQSHSMGIREAGWHVAKRAHIRHRLDLISEEPGQAHSTA